MKLRAEWFGAVAALESPHLLVELNRAFARRLGLTDSARWRGSDPGHLSAPTEVHLVVSKQCSAGCTGCYVDATPKGAAISLEHGKRALEALAARGVFHVAMGGGEALELPYLFELAAHARAVGLVPNLTTAGLGLTEAQAEACRVFGQVNVSVDGVGARYREARGFDGYARAERALRMLRARVERVGINFVVSRSSQPHLGEVVALAKRLGLDEVELLRFKPSGRGRGAFAHEEQTPEQARGLWPEVRWLAVRHRMRLKLDCSFAPMLFAHRPSVAVARFLGVVGCEGGNVLASVMPDGQLTGCSFGGPNEGHILDDAAVDHAFAHGFKAFRGHVKRAPEPCRGCEAQAACKGGCRVVSEASGDWHAPDPGCPKVVAWKLDQQEPVPLRFARR